MQDMRWKSGHVYEFFLCKMRDENLEMFILAKFFVQKRGGYQFFVLEFFVLDKGWKSGHVYN